MMYVIETIQTSNGHKVLIARDSNGALLTSSVDDPKPIVDLIVNDKADSVEMELASGMK